ncbi:MAG: GH3 auxin-responsive promoter family protein [Planctomycetes bacterium]|nr:GH3 auxin-responsive promoter family protein [Planctomycetota bacterium]
MIDQTMRFFARRRLRRLRALASDPAAAQEQVRASLVRRARDTELGRELRFERVKSYADFCAAVPLGGYAAWAPRLERARAGRADVCWPGQVEAWALSSGTTSGEKYLPVTRDSIRSHQGGGFDALAPHLAEARASVFAGKSLFLGGSMGLRREGRAWVGDNTGIMARRIPRLAQRWRLPRREIASLASWEEKIERASREALHEDVRLLAGTPSWMLLFAERVLREARAVGRPAENLRALWPELQLFLHGGTDFAPYRERFARLAGPGVRCIDTYSASEGGMFAVQDRADAEGMLPLVDRGVFFELVPREDLERAQPTRLRLHEAELGIDYAVVVSTDAGLFGYLLGDLVRLVSRDPLRLVFAGRVAHTLNAFGEHVCGGELERAVQHAAWTLRTRVAEFAVAVQLADADLEVGRHVYYVELEPGAPRVDRERFAAALDERIAAGNEDYATHRSFGLELPRVVFVPSGSFHAWMRERGTWGGQHKVPRVLSPELLASFSPAHEVLHATSHGSA